MENDQSSLPAKYMQTTLMELGIGKERKKGRINHNQRGNKK
jgi:hypothetical protein